MSVHVCPCMHHGAVEWHLRYPGMSQEAAQGIADKINSGMLDSKQAHHIAALAARVERLEGLLIDIGMDRQCGHWRRDIDAALAKGEWEK